MPMGAGKFLPAPGKERPDYTIFTGPAANVNDGASEEIELDQALSLAGRFGRDLLGCQVYGMYSAFVAEHATIAGADHEMRADFELNTRTGDFDPADPEFLWAYQIAQAVAAGATDTATIVMNLQDFFGNDMLGEPELYVAPRLFWRFANNMDAVVVANEWEVRISSISRKLSFQLFVELLERFADVTLL